MTDRTPLLAPLLTSLGLRAHDHRRAVAIAALLVLAVAAALGLPPRVDTAPTALLPEDEPHAAALAGMADALGSTGGITLVFDAEASLDGLVAELEQIDGVATAFAGLPEDAALHLALMHLDPAAVERFTQRLTLALSLGPSLNPMLAARILGDTRLPEPAAPGPGLLPDDGAQRILLLPERPSFEAPFSERLVRDIRARVAASEQAGHLLHIGGSHVVAADGAASVRSDLVATSGISAVLVLAVLVVGTRSLRAPLLLFPPLIVSNVVLLALLGGLFGALNTFTSLGTAVLIGLGIDFGIHLLGRVGEERAAGRDTREAIGRAWGTAGPPCVYAALTSTAGFLAASAGEFRGLSELGIALGVGLQLALVAMLVLLPGLIAWLGAFPPVGTRGAVLQDASAPTPSTGARLGPVRVALLAIVLGTVGVGLWGGRHLTFEYDFSRIGRLDLQHDRLAPRTRALVTQALPPIAFTLEDAEDARAFAARSRDALDAGRLPHVRAVVATDDLLPTDQADRAEALAALRTLAVDPGARFLPSSVNRVLEPLRHWTPGQRSLEELSPTLDALLLSGRRVLLFPRGDLHDMRETAALVRELDALGETGTSIHLLQGVVYTSITSDAPRVVLLALVLVALLVFLDLRRPGPTLLVVAALMTGMVWAVGAVAGTGIRVGLGNLIGFPILLGIGVDVVIHLAHRLEEDALPVVIRTSGKAALISTLTTIVSFVALNIAESGAIRSLGQLVAVGLTTVAVVSAATLLLAWTAQARQPPGAHTRRKPT